MNTKHYLFILIALCLFSCGGKSHQDNKLETISINGNIRQTLNLSSFVDTIEFIPLETNDENLIGEVDRIIYRNGKYYLRTTHGMQNGKLSVFDKTGKYLWGLNKRGNGAGEYPDFEDFLITNNGDISILAYPKIINYDSTGTFLSENKLNLFLKEFMLFGNKDFIGPVFKAIDNKLLSIIKDKGYKQEFLFKRTKLEAKKSTFMDNYRSITSFKSTIFFMYPYSDTIYSINNENKIKPSYYVNYVNKKIPVDILNIQDDVLTWEKKIHKLEDYMLLSAIGITENYIYIGSINKSFQAFFTLYSKKNKHILTAHKLIDNMFLKGNEIMITAQNMPHEIDGNDILWPLDPEYLINGYKHYMSYLSDAGREEFRKKYPELVRICTTLKEDDNPVILRIKVKDF
jgi:hypothetical protein